jgi:hypothetical protein
MISSRSCSLPFKGRAGVGIGFEGDLPHPPPGLPLEGGGEPKWLGLPLEGGAPKWPRVLIEVGGVTA